jgi:hypothetical protein
VGWQGCYGFVAESGVGSGDRDILSCESEIVMGSVPFGVCATVAELAWTRDSAIPATNGGRLAAGLAINLAHGERPFVDHGAGSE